MTGRDASEHPDRFEVELAKALVDEAYRSPLHLEAGQVRDRLMASRRPAWRPWQWAIAAGLIVIAFVGVAFVALRLPAVSGPGASGTCDVSVVTRHGTWWDEIGGPHAFFNARPQQYFYASTNPWLIIVRFDPDATNERSLSMWAERLGSEERVDGAFNSRMNPTGIGHFGESAPSLPGGWYLFEQTFPNVGCWRLSAAIDGKTVGSAVVRIDFGGPEGTPSSSAPTPGLASSPGATRAR